MPRLRLSPIRTFDAVARHGNFRLAAEELNLTHGAVAQQIRALEDQLGLPLFERLPRGVTLTGSGAHLAKASRTALDLIDQAVDALGTDQKTLQISVPPSFAARWLVAAVPEFEAAHPDLRLAICADEKVQPLRRGIVDAAIRMGPCPKVQGGEVTRLKTVELVAVATPDYAERVGSAPEFKGAVLLQDAHGYWDRFLPGRDRDIRRYNYTVLAIDAAIEGQGVAIAPRLLVEKPLRRGDLREIWQPQTGGDIGYYLIHAAGLQSADPVLRFAGWIANALA
ncbi:Gcv operon activator [Thalassovita gelatinovora]|uniref:Gcv operon activator n=2 Tax=Thalassovita gelatinovora TaxID=53501 RepID=A0A0P1F573_THAGE|nr:LysR substrate-binding domain-containing protein [Thalassovita gelatinovora]CUH62980.1 Gcv operon activator [Thalassovita gelatinovora]SEQ13455.1 LysR family transcriptional regulator, glycine cleavage system transcriptional activator [Thalassovita gelatinovora]